MPNVSEKKKKLLYLLKILLEKTDGEHALTLPQLLDELEALGVSAERKSIYDDIETLRSVGVEIETKKTKTFQYYIEKRRFSIEELQLLAEVLREAGSLLNGQAEELIGKLEGMCSVYQRELLRKRLPVQAGAAEAPVPAGTEILRRALMENRQVSFQLLEWSLSSSGRPRHEVRKGAKPLAVSPWKLIWNRDRCELLAYDAALKKVRRFRAEEIASPQILPLEREGESAVRDFEARRGPEEKIVLEFSPEMLGVVTERFGGNFAAEAAGKNRLRASLRVQPGPEFFSWLFLHGPEIRLAAPKKLAEQCRERAKAMAKLYKP